MTENRHRHAGEAALGVLESLLIHLAETGVLGDADHDMILEAVLETHRSAFEADGDPRHTAIIALIRSLQAGTTGIAARPRRSDAAV